MATKDLVKVPSWYRIDQEIHVFLASFPHGTLLIDPISKTFEPNRVMAILSAYSGILMLHEPLMPIDEHSRQKCLASCNNIAQLLQVNSSGLV